METVINLLGLLATIAVFAFGWKLGDDLQKELKI